MAAREFYLILLSSLLESRFFFWQVLKPIQKFQVKASETATENYDSVHGLPFWKMNPSLAPLLQQISENYVPLMIKA